MQKHAFHLDRPKNVLVTSTPSCCRARCGTSGVNHPAQDTSLDMFQTRWDKKGWIGNMHSRRNINSTSLNGSSYSTHNASWQGVTQAIIKHQLKITIQVSAYTQTTRTYDMSALAYASMHTSNKRSKHTCCFSSYKSALSSLTTLQQVNST